MDEDEEPQPRRRPLAWILIAGAGAAATWIAALPLDGIVPAPRPESRAIVPPEAPARELAATPDLEAHAPEPAAPSARDAGAPPATVLLEPPPEWFEETPGDAVEPPSAPEALHARLQRQLAMNDLHGVRVELAGDRIVTSGVVPHSRDLQRVALIVRSLAPDWVHEEHVAVAGER